MALVALTGGFVTVKCEVFVSNHYQGTVAPSKETYPLPLILTSSTSGRIGGELDPERHLERAARVNE